MATVLVSVNGATIKDPQQFGIERYNLTNSGRVASGRMKMDLVAKKRKFTCKYPVMSGPEIDAMRAVIDTDVMFFPLIYLENDVQYTVTVYVGAIKYERFRTNQGWYWQNVTYDFIEQ